MTTGSHDPLVLQGVGVSWSLVSTPGLRTGLDSGFAAITAILGGGLWAVGVTASSKGHYSTLIEYTHNGSRTNPVLATSKLRGQAFGC